MWDNLGHYLVKHMADHCIFCTLMVNHVLDQNKIQPVPSIHHPLSSIREISEGKGSAGGG
jgi:hypothetical protein